MKDGKDGGDEEDEDLKRRERAKDRQGLSSVMTSGE